MAIALSEKVRILSAPPATNILVTVVLPLLCIIGVLGNILICTAIWLDRRLHNVTNYFLFSLALADLFVCTVVMPISLVVEIHQGKFSAYSFSNYHQSKNFHKDYVPRGLNTAHHYEREGNIGSPKSSKKRFLKCRQRGFKIWRSEKRNHCLEAKQKKINK